MAVTTAYDLLQLVEKSRLLTPQQVAEVRSWPEREAQALADRLVAEGWITPWQQEMLLAGNAKFFYGKYKLLDLLGVGGMGRVYKAIAVPTVDVQRVVGRVVALKVVNRAVLKQPRALERFKREIQSAAAIDHPNIVHAYDANQDGDNYFLVMEFVPGRNLKSWIQKEKTLPIGWWCECIRQAALGLQHAFERGMVHRDIKPSNLLVTQNESDGLPLVKILDFGLARFASETPDDGELTRSGQVLGTPDYIAPEQASNTRTADIRADIFSLGCALFEMLTGKLPFPGESVMEKLMARASRDAPPVRSLRPDVPLELEGVIARMLARNPNDRYTTPAEVAQALAPFAIGTAGQGPVRGIAPPAPPQFPEPRSSSGLSAFNFLQEATVRGSAEETAGLAGGDGSGAESGRWRRLWGRPGVRAGAAAGGVILIALIVLSLLPGHKRPAESAARNLAGHQKQHPPAAVVGDNETGFVGEGDAERAAARHLLELGGSLVVSISARRVADSKEPEDANQQPVRESRELHRIEDLPKRTFQIVAVDVHERPLETGDIQGLAELKHLTRLNLAGTSVTDHALDNLKSLASLTDLDLSNTQISDAGVRRLKELSSLQSLQLAQTPIGGGALEQLKSLSRLTALSLAETQIADFDLRHLAAMTQLESLNLAGTRVKGPGLRALKPLQNLTRLDLSGLPMQGPAFAQLNGLERLESLRLTRARVKDDDLAHLSGLTRLRELFLDSTSIAGPGLKHLAWMADLERLDLQGTVVGDAGLTFVSGLTSLTVFNLRGTAVSDAGLESLRSLSRLESLNVIDTKVTAKGIESLRKSLANCQIDY